MEIPIENFNSNYNGLIQSFPEEILENIFINLPDEVIQTLPLISRQWKDVSRDNFLLRAVVSRYFPNIQLAKETENKSCYEWLKSEFDKSKNLFRSTKNCVESVLKIYGKDEYFKEPEQNLNDLSGLALLNALKEWEIDQEIGEICNRCKYLESFENFEKEVRESYQESRECILLLNVLREWETLWNLEVLCSKIKNYDNRKQEIEYSSKNICEKTQFIREAIKNVGEDTLNSITSILFDYNLTSIPAEICQFSQLQSLMFHYSKLSKLPIEITELKLECLNLVCTSFRSLPSEIGKLTQLTSLDLRHNPLVNFVNFSSEIDKLTQLTSLDLDYVQSEVPQFLAELTQCKELRIHFWE